MFFACYSVSNYAFRHFSDALKLLFTHQFYVDMGG